MVDNNDRLDSQSIPVITSSVWIFLVGEKFLEKCVTVKMRRTFVFVCRNDQLSKAWEILECLPQKGFGCV